VLLATGKGSKIVIKKVRQLEVLQRLCCQRIVSSTVVLEKTLLPEQTHHHEVMHFDREGHRVFLGKVRERSLRCRAVGLLQVVALHEQLPLVRYLLLKSPKERGFTGTVVPDDGNKGRGRYRKRKVADENTLSVTRNQIFCLDDQILNQLEMQNSKLEMREVCSGTISNF